VSVVYGDRDTFIDYQWTADAIARSCVMSGTVVATVAEGKGHGDVDLADQIAWVAQRFAGDPVSNTC
jgi:hypothetical protein